MSVLLEGPVIDFLKETRFYQLSLSKFCSEACSYCSGLGGLTEGKSLEDIGVSLKKAQSGEYTAALLPCNFLFQKNILDILDQIQKSNLEIIIQVNASFIHPGWQEVFDKIQKYKPTINCVIGEFSDDVIAALKYLKEIQTPVYYTIVGHKNFDIISLLDTVPRSDYHKYFFSFPYKLDERSEFLTTREIYRTIKKIQQNYKGFIVRPAPGLDTYEPRLAEGVDLEPVVQPSLVTHSSNPRVQVSVVIPTFNNNLYLQNTLKHLFKQDMSKNDFEIIVVDDGSDDGSLLGAEKLINRNKESFNFKYIYYPRAVARKMGDGQFRAGVARNLGVKRAQGELLVFLDSDILTPKNYLSRLVREHQDWDVIQTERVYLNKDISDEKTIYDLVNIKTDTYIPEGGYWHKFYRSTDREAWQNLAYSWKYVCTYGLSMKTSVFKNIGWFKKNYIFYGFEDTDLGFRLYQKGYRFYRSPLICLHLYHETQRSEFSNSDYLRHLLLKKTAKIFFHNHLSLEIFDHFKSLVDEGLSFRGLLAKVALKLRSCFGQ